jgi:hypothetical protein
MDKIFALILQLAFILGIQISLLIPLTILAIFIRKMAVRGIRKIKYRQKLKTYEKYGLDLFQIPESLHSLIPYAIQFGAMDSQKRKDNQGKATLEEKRAFARVIRGKESEIHNWLKAIYPDYSKEAQLFAFMIVSLYELNLLVDYQPSFFSSVEVYAGATSAPIKKRMIYYQPRPKSWIEKFFYNLISGIIVAIIFPVFYYLIAKAWSVFSPDEETVVAFGIICTLAALFSLFTFNSASWAIKRVWKQYI